MLVVLFFTRMCFISIFIKLAIIKLINKKFFHIINRINTQQKIMNLMHLFIFLVPEILSKFNISLKENENNRAPISLFTQKKKKYHH